ncbi:MAG: hypothetical protein ACQEQ4_02020 [Fibrobacterota bacterium]
MRNFICLLLSLWAIACSSSPSEEHDRAEITDSLFFVYDTEVPELYEYYFDDTVLALSEEDAWNMYRKLRAEAIAAEESGDVPAALFNRLRAAEVQVHLQRPGIASWQFNNAGNLMMTLISKIQQCDTASTDTAGSTHRDIQSIARYIGTETHHLYQWAFLFFTTAYDFNADNPDAQRERIIKGNIAHVKQQLQTP